MDLINKAVAKLPSDSVYVGIPESAAAREVTKRQKRVNNAQLLWLHTKGSPLRHVPARPVIEPAIEAEGNKQAIVEELKDSIAARLDGDEQKSNQYLERAGIAGMDAAKGWFVDARNNWKPNMPSTIARKGSARPLIDTGQLRKSITYIVKTG